MSGSFLLDWATLAVSLFITILLFWLGLTVLLTAERRTWGVWLAGAGLLSGAAFFVSHTAILGQSLLPAGPGVNFWWQIGWWPVIASPFAWYIIILWYAGYWEDPQAPLRRRQQPWFVLILLMTILLVGLLLFANLLPSFSQVMQLNLANVPTVGGVPLLILVYPPYIILCILLALDALLRPGPTTRVMGEFARRRARPWLAASSLALLAVSLMVAAALYWVTLTPRAYTSPAEVTARLSYELAWFDLVIAATIGAAVLMLGQAIVSYEIFTGKTLARQGLKRHWQNAVLLALWCSVLTAWSLTVQLRPIYILLLAVLVMTAFYAALGWRSYVERETAIRQLRPFIASQNLTDPLLAQPEDGPPPPDVNAPFAALCEEILGASQAALTAVGPLASLAGPPLVYPKDLDWSAPQLADLTRAPYSPEVMIVPLDPLAAGGMSWAAPLWSERGLSGLLLLGGKAGGGFYAQEEIEIARASGERLIDMQASAGLTRRLITLQRQRIAETQVLDRQARRALHDDILPRIHAALLELSALPASPPVEASLSALSEAHRRTAALLREIPAAPLPELDRLGLFGALREVLSSELANQFERVTWQVEPEAERRARALPPLTREVLYYAARETLRNAARYGRGDDPARSLHLAVRADWQDGLTLTVEDDGVGMGTPAPNDAASGQGLALHGGMMGAVGGALAVESQPGVYTRVTLSLPASEFGE